MNTILERLVGFYRPMWKYRPQGTEWCLWVMSWVSFVVPVPLFVVSLVFGWWVLLAESLLTAWMGLYLFPDTLGVWQRLEEGRKRAEYAADDAQRVLREIRDRVRELTH